MNLTLHETQIMYSVPDSLPDYEPLQGEIVPLEEEDFLQAHQMSQRLPGSQDDSQEWGIYLHYLALKACQRWFSQHATPVPLDISEAFVLLTDSTESSPGQIVVCQIQMPPFKLCCIVTDGSADHWQIPLTAMQTTHLAAHFYLPIAIQEESSQAEILGFLRRDQIPETAIDRDCYRLPIDAVNPDLDVLLLYLSCLEPQALPLPTTNLPLGQNLRQLLLQPILRTGQWLNQQLDNATDRLLDSWQLLPTWEIAGATRGGMRDMAIDSPMGDLSAILVSLMREGMVIPVEHRPAYQDFQLAALNLRLYVVIAAQETPNQPPEWLLLAILRQQNGMDLPTGVRLQIMDAEQMLVDRETGLSPADYLYARVIGDQTEQFTLALSYENQILMLPPFSFQADV
jgi:hypothetical protein